MFCLCFCLCLLTLCPGNIYVCSLCTYGNSIQNVHVIDLVCHSSSLGFYESVSLVRSATMCNSAAYNQIHRKDVVFPGLIFVFCYTNPVTLSIINPLR